MRSYDAPTSATTESPTGLRADVGQLVRRLLREAPRAGGDQAWQAYERAKRLISGACGDDAPAELHDRQQYDRAIATYSRGAGL